MHLGVYDQHTAPLRPTHVVVDLGAIAHNVRFIKERLSPATRLLAVVKADAYGHGVMPVVHCAVKNGADAVGVAIVEEGVALREAGVHEMILVMGSVPRSHWQTCVTYGLSLTVDAPSQLPLIEREAAALGLSARVHVKLDTGMGRIGLRSKEEIDALIDAMRTCPHIVWEGLFTHFAISDEWEDDFTRAQWARFAQWAAYVQEAGFTPALHAANSGGVLYWEKTHADLVRAGIVLYGYDPSEKPRFAEHLRPALTWKTSVVHVKEIEAGDSVSYGRLFVAQEKRRIATIPVGYADGYARSLGGVGQVLIAGRRADVVGRVCMDQCMVDVTNIPAVAVGDEVVLLGAQGGDAIWADEMGRWLHTISYEVLCDIGPRVPRIYVGKDDA